MVDFKKNNYLLNEKVNKCLTHIIKKESFANGYIFYGVEGVGKKQTAFKFIGEIFKKYSPNENFEESIINNNHPDLLTIEPSSPLENQKSKSSELEKPLKSGSEIIKITQVRSIKTFLGQKSIESEKKIVLIIDAHLLNEAASNCLLKTLEEPSNGIFILLTSKLNLLLNTIISRCQIIRFRSFSGKEINSISKDYFDPSVFTINRILKFQDLINSANGSPGQLLKNIEIWNELTDQITSKLSSPIKSSLEILEVSKYITEQLQPHRQIYLVNLIQIIWWRNTNNINLVKKLENLKLYLRNKVNPRLAWETTFLKILMEDL